MELQSICLRVILPIVALALNATVIVYFMPRNISTNVSSNLSRNFVCPHPYIQILGLSNLAMVPTVDDLSDLLVMRHSFWLYGSKDDFQTIQQIKRTACEDDEIPVIVISMHPSKWLPLNVEASHYMPDPKIYTWEEYDEKIEEYAEHLREVPSLIVMEPSLLMHTFNSRTQYHNSDYQLKFADSVDKVAKAFPNSWIYVDAGNAMYLQWGINMQHVIEVLSLMPKSIRGFSINVGSFVNVTFNEQLADKIHCQTGLHYIIDTSRNGGDFSYRTLDEINECKYDPPQVRHSINPMWGGGVNNRKLAFQDADIVEDVTPDPFNRKKRWVLENPKTQYDPIFGAGPAAGAVDGNTEGGYSGYGYYSYTGYESSSTICITTDQSGLDAYAWVKTPGESDGRLYPSGTYHPCLIDHFQECSETCPQYVPKNAGEFVRLDACRCE